MTAPLRIGFHPLNDCALLAVAQECGMFEGEGLSVTLSREPSWSNIRDKLAYGLLEAAHCLAPMPIASALGLGSGGAARLIAPMALGLNGNSVVAANGLADEIGPVTGAAEAGAAIARVVRAREAAGRAPLVFGVPFLFSAHAYVLRRWLGEAGIDPARDVSIVVAPPVRMSSMARQGVVDAFCVGAPWGQSTVLEGGGRLLFSDQDYWAQKPEKVLAASLEWAIAAPETLQALLRALMRAAVWADAAGNRKSLVEILSSPLYLGAPAAYISAAFGGPLSAGHTFASLHGAYPWPHHGRWFARQMQTWDGAPKAALAAAEAVYRPDLWRIAAAGVGLTAPAAGAAPPDPAGEPLP
jgi:NitT/TauT family transport system ATP-binding protein/nitrate/nitrite transport system substrate-binding protein